MQIVLDTRGLQMSVRNKCFLIAFEKNASIVHPDKVGSILITAPCRISSPALILAAENQIPVVICNNSGKPSARIWSPHFINISTLRRGQYQFSVSLQGLNWAEDIINLKIAGQIETLNFLADHFDQLRDKLKGVIPGINFQAQKQQIRNEQTDLPTYKKKILFTEAYAAAQYWQLAGMYLPMPFAFHKRSKRPARDITNVCINYLYGMLRNETETAILSIGMDPALGIIHRDGYHMPSLVFDLMEPFRPIVDQQLFAAIIKNTIPHDICLQEGESLILNKAGRKVLIKIFTGLLYGKITYRNKTNTMRNHILTEAKQLATLISKS